VRGHDPASRRIIEDEAVEEERAGAGDPTDPQPPKVAVPVTPTALGGLKVRFSRSVAGNSRVNLFLAHWPVTRYAVTRDTRGYSYGASS
jgi:hypothetical protein